MTFLALFATRRISTIRQWRRPAVAITDKLSVTTAAAAESFGTVCSRTPAKRSAAYPTIPVTGLDRDEEDLRARGRKLAADYKKAPRRGTHDDISDAKLAGANFVWRTVDIHEIRAGPRKVQDPDHLPPAP
jgi:hypothetical protein